jgi:hypothetical protein
MVREYTNKLLEMVEEGIADKDYVIQSFCTFCSEDDVEDMMRSNDLILEDEDDEDEE